MIRRRIQSDSDKQAVVPYEKCPAKTFLNPAGEIHLGRRVLNHCVIVGKVAEALIERYPPDIRSVLFQSGAVLTAAAHDIGKVSPCFYEKLRRACLSGSNAMPVLDAIQPELERSWGGHAGVSQVTARQLGAPDYVPEILGQHHGYTPPVGDKRANDEIFGGPGWQQQREALVSELMKVLGCDWPAIRSAHEARLLAGLTSVADWIGSGEFFENPDEPWEENISLALDAAGFVPPAYQSGLTFREVFQFDPHPLQIALIEQVQSSGVYVLEAPMGLGKTEAALYAAYQMLCSGKASGIYFALPTQLTSNKIFERFNTYLNKILAVDSRRSSLLLHGAAWLMDTEMGEEGRPGGAWFNHAKRGLLAPFAVGTLDQALMATMNVKHGFVRAFGLAGKVVILDEVHTYDAYTGTLLDALVEMLRELYCTVIILSATLQHDRRQTLLARTVYSHHYPLVTAVPHLQEATEIRAKVDLHQRVALSMIDNDEIALQEAINRASAGQQVLWIENTVSEAQERYLTLAARAAELQLRSGLLHSRFTQTDRLDIENYWVNLFGKSGWKIRLQQGRILIGTQVLEQSLDIDADFLITRFAPTDMLLQRTGRLWRHANTPRPATAVCEAWVLAPDLQKALPAAYEAFGKTAHVYSPYVLCRSLEVWQGRFWLDLPHDIRGLIEQTYLPREEEGDMARWLYELEHGIPGRKLGRRAMRQLARLSLAEGGNTLPESKAQTRYSEIDTHEVLLLRALAPLPEQRTSLLTLMNGEKLHLPWQRHKQTKEDWRRLSAKLMQQVVTVNVMDAPLPLPVEMLRKLGFQHCFYLGHQAQDEAILRVMLVNETGDLQGVNGMNVHDKHTFNYRVDLGYRVLRSNGK